MTPGPDRVPPPPCTRYAPELFDSTVLATHLKCRTVCASCSFVLGCLDRASKIASKRTESNANEIGPDGTWAGLLWRDGQIVPLGQNDKGEVVLA